MKTFQIVREISSGRAVFDGKMVRTTMAIVRFPDGDTTRHLVMNGGGVLTSWNSDNARRERAEILEARQRYDEAVKDGESLNGKLETELAGLKGKRGVNATADRKRLKTLLESNKAALAVLKTGQARAIAVAGKVDETHPEIVEFV